MGRGGSGVAFYSPRPLSLVSGEGPYRHARQCPPFRIDPPRYDRGFCCDPQESGDKEESDRAGNKECDDEARDGRRHKGRDGEEDAKH